ncbi:Hypothetical protein, predicted lipoprotein [Mycoplasmopsis agalactiae 14628]|uniref:Variable surface lipoprotein n=1 Tax=Mycoplasmopsis agalactiae 14628 TaxID=1110504 RepID=I5D530_MYCAA|nr:variable surface lipoprotein [Mycoplasmopsis agalactiae]EIN14789.1 Hypothetical protein, predicted lipoprotein [Mycoplasmopsis agalactiae 14628]
MKKSFKLLLAATTISATAAPLLAASCDTAESKDGTIINNLIDNADKDLNKNKNPKSEAMNEPHKPNNDTDKKLDNDKNKNDPKSSDNETTETGKKSDEINKKDSEDQKNGDKYSQSSPKGEKEEKDEKSEKNENESRSDSGSVTPSPETETPPSTPPAPAPQPQPEMPPADQPKGEEETESNKEESELDKIAKDLKDILKFAASTEDYPEIKEFSSSNSSYTLWYNSKDRTILLVKGSQSPFIENSEKVDKFVLFEFDRENKIKDNIQLVNDKNPLNKSNEDGHDIFTLSNQLNFEILNKSGENKFDVKVKYKVGNSLNSSEAEASDVSNESTVTIELK